MQRYHRITESDREQIMVQKQKGLNQAAIARLIGKNQSSVSRELKKGLDKKIYNPILAQKITLRRNLERKRPLLINTPTWTVINNHLALRWSPKQIEDFLKRPSNDANINTVSEKTIYNYIQFHLKGELKKLALSELRQKGKKRRSGDDKRGKLVNMTLIDQRPAEIETRESFGHWEGDLIIGKDHKSALSVIVERKFRYLMIDRLLQYDAETVRKSIEKRLRSLDPALFETITCDQGKEMAQHEKLAKKMKLKIYFCHPHSPWEKGTCENSNFLIRDMLNGETDFRNLSQQFIHKIANQLNDRPRQTLGFKTPKEKLTELCASRC